MAEFPKFLSRWGADGKREKKLFNSAAEIEPGWVEQKDLGPPPLEGALKEGVKTATKGDAKADEQIAALKALQVSSDGIMAAQAARIEELEAFVVSFRDDDNAPQAVRDMAAALVPAETDAPAEAAPAKQAKGGKQR